MYTFLALYFGTMGLALIAANLGLTVAYLVVYAMLEPCKRIASFFLYPVAYLSRNYLRTSAVTWQGYLYKPASNGVFLKWYLWLFLDDSLMFSQGKEYDDKEKRYPGWIWRSESPFLKAWWWAGIRNSMVNWNNLEAHCVGFHVASIPDKRTPGKTNFYELHIYDTGEVRPYYEGVHFGRWNQIGWLRGNKAANGASRFEIDIMKKR